MHPHFILQFTIIAAVTVSPIYSACSKKPSTTAIITGLFPIHNGDNCSKVDIRSLQQVAALKSTINALNSEAKDGSGINLSFKLLDTCGNADGAVRAALKALVDPEQMCPNPPFFLGFVGPEEKESLTAVHQVTHVFNTTHVIPFTLDNTNDFNEDSVLQVEKRKPQDQAQSILMALNQLDWTSFSLAVDNSPVSQLQASSLISLVQQDSSLCLKGNIARLTDTTSINEALTGNGGHGIVVLVDSSETAAKVLQVNKVIQAPLVLLVNNIGLQSWQIPPVNSTLIILQEISSENIDGLEETINATLYSEYITQQDQLYREEYCKHSGNVANCMQNMREDIFQESSDPSLLPLSYAVRLMSSALQLAHKAKCASAQGVCSQLTHMPVAEWRNFLRISSAFVKQANKGMPARIKFQMELTTMLEIYSRNKATSSLEKIGLMTNGKKLQMTSGSTFPVTTDSTLRDTKCPTDEALQIVPTIFAAPPKTTPSVVILEPVEAHTEQEFYEMVTLLCGAGLGILIFFLLMTYIVYSSFKVKNEDTSAGGDSFEKKPPSRIARWRRGSGHSSRASIRTID